MMSKVIPILPCPDIRQQTAFYEQLGFEIKGIYTSPNAYVVVQLGAIELHFWGTRKVEPAENSSMCYIQVEDVDAVNSAFTTSLKAHTGKVPRSGIPKITKVRDLVGDRRFTLTDPGGNTMYIGTPVNDGTVNFFRTLQHEKFAKKFTVLYDMVYSKEDPALAAETLPRFGIDKDQLTNLDKAKYLLVLLEIQRALDQPLDDLEIAALLKDNKDGGDDWSRIEKTYRSIVKEGEV
jgi:hypothetical protein